MSIYILAIDTATEACSAALMIDENIILKRFIVDAYKHTEHILPMVEDILSEAGITLKKLDAIAFSHGPGSFTGIRISIGIAQGLALGANLPLIGISTLSTLAEGAWRQTKIFQVITAIDARMGEVYWAPYQRTESGIWIEQKPEAVITPDQLSILSLDLTGCWATAGTGWKTYPKLFHHHKNLQLVTGYTLFPSAQDILPQALYYYRLGNKRPIPTAEPIYLRHTVALKNHLKKSK